MPLISIILSSHFDLNFIHHFNRFLLHPARSLGFCIRWIFEMPWQQNLKQTNTEENKVSGSVHKRLFMYTLGNLNHQLLSGSIDPDTYSSELGVGVCFLISTKQRKIVSNGLVVFTKTSFWCPCTDTAELLLAFRSRFSSQTELC